MFKKIAGTIGTRVVVAALTFLVVVMNTNFLGPEKVGTISLVIFAITIVQMVNNFIGGASLAYFVPRAPLIRLFLPAVAWSFVSSLGVVLVLQASGAIPVGFFVHVMILSLLQSLASVNLMILLGREKIRAINTVSLAQIIILVLTLLFLFFIQKNREIISYIVGLYLSYFLAFSWSLTLVLPAVRRVPLTGTWKLFRGVLSYGGWAQAGNLFQLFNYRISYYFIRIFTGKGPLGVYSVGIQLSEGLWILSRSISMVQFARISNQDDHGYAARLTLLFVKISFLATVILLGGILLLPESFFVFIFGQGFSGVKMVMFSLAAGIALLSVSIVISPYFSGTGRPWVNTIGAAIGLVFTLLLSFILVPVYGIIGAGIAASVAYGASTLFQMVLFIRLTKARPADFLLHKSEWQALKQVLCSGLFINTRDS
jgi:O-antigen/teichoic acid export membrane protein